MILHQNEEPLFLIEELDDSYRFTDKMIDESKIDILFDGEKLVIPVKYVSENAKITVTVKEKAKTETIDDWKIDEVIRKKENKLDTFQAVYKSKTAENFKYKIILFEDQADSRVYDSLMSDIETLAKEARKISGNSEGTVTEENFEEMRTFVQKLMDILTGENGHFNAINDLLMNEKFFTEVFYPQ